MYDQLRASAQRSESDVLVSRSELIQLLEDYDILQRTVDNIARLPIHSLVFASTESGQDVIYVRDFIGALGVEAVVDRSVQ